MANKLHIAAGPAGLFRCSFHCLILLFFMVLVTTTIYLSKESITVPENSLWTPIINVISSFSKSSNISGNSLKPDQKGGISLPSMNHIGSPLLMPNNNSGNSSKPDGKAGISLPPMNHIGSPLLMPNNNSENSSKRDGKGGISLPRMNHNGSPLLMPNNNSGNSFKPDGKGGISLAPMNHIGSPLSTPNNNSGNSSKQNGKGGIFLPRMNHNGSSLLMPYKNTGNSSKPDENSGISLPPMNHIGSPLLMPNNNFENSSKPDEKGGISLPPRSHIGSPLSMPNNNSRNSSKLDGKGGISLPPRSHIGSPLSMPNNNSGNSSKLDGKGGISLPRLNHNGSPLLMPYNNTGNSTKPDGKGGISLPPLNHIGSPLLMPNNNSENSSKPDGQGGISLPPRNHIGSSLLMPNNNSGNSSKPDGKGGISLPPMNHNGSPLLMPYNNSRNSLKPDGKGGISLPPMNHIRSPLLMPNNNSRNSSKPKSDRNSLKQCDFFSGKWVYDNNSYPLYKDHQCPYMFDDLACEKFGRKDLKYQNWRWQPNNCDIPRFDGKALLERLKDKRLVFVGDSVNRNQWVSMMCMLESSIPKGLKSMHVNGSLCTFKATEYNASIDYYWAPVLVESSADDPGKHRSNSLIVKTDAIETHAKHWSDADILIFNSYLWWKAIPDIKVSLGSSESLKKVDNEVKLRHWYKMVLKTWSDWLDTHVNRTKTKLFFVSMTATHSQAKEWGRKRDNKCLNESEPIMKEGYWGSRSDPKMMRIVEEVIKRMKTKGLEIQLLNVTQLTEYRKDGHPSVYKKQWWPLTKEQLSNPFTYADCTHWCLPGVPDVWNEILSAYIVHL